MNTRSNNQKKLKQIQNQNPIAKAIKTILNPLKASFSTLKINLQIEDSPVLTLSLPQRILVTHKQKINFPKIQQALILNHLPKSTITLLILMNPQAPQILAKTLKKQKNPQLILLQILKAMIIV